MSNRILLSGDTHGDARSVFHKVDEAVKHGVQRIVILGDFGLWWRYDGVKFIDEINAYATKHNRQIFALPGNHENYDWWNAAVEAAQKSKATAHGWAYLRTNVLLSPRVHDFVWGGKQFVVAGGAVSIDKAERLAYERETGKRIWSKDEQLADSEVDELLATRFAHGVKVDYLLTHDCSNMTPWRDRLKPDFESQIHRQRIDRVLRAIQPKLHFHGHMHTKYDWMNLTGDDFWTQTYGLECNRDLNSWGILDLGTDEFKFAVDFEEKPVPDYNPVVPFDDDF
jgi:hypothetical protein